MIEALEQRRAEALPAVLTEDVVQITAFSPEGGLEPFKRYAGRDAVVGHLAGVFRSFAAVKLDRTGLFVSHDGTTVFLEVLGDMTMADSGTAYRNRYVFKFVLRQGRVAELTNYFNPVTFAQRMAIQIKNIHEPPV